MLDRQKDVGHCVAPRSLSMEDVFLGTRLPLKGVSSTKSEVFYTDNNGYQKVYLLVLEM